MKKNIGAKIFFFPPWDAKLTKAMESPLLGLWDGDRPSDLWNGLSIIFPGWDSSFSEVISQLTIYYLCMGTISFFKNISILNIYMKRGLLSYFNSFYPNLRIK